jgi:hypothetical protein
MVYLLGQPIARAEPLDHITGNPEKYFEPPEKPLGGNREFELRSDLMMTPPWNYRRGYDLMRMTLCAGGDPSTTPGSVARSNDDCYDRLRREMYPPANIPPAPPLPGATPPPDPLQEYWKAMQRAVGGAALEPEQGMVLALGPNVAALHRASMNPPAPPPPAPTTSVYG